MSYLVTALRSDDEIVSIDVDAASPHEAERHAAAQGYAVLGVKRKSIANVSRAHRSQRFSSSLFSQELLALLGAGLSLVEALQALKSKRQYAAAGIVDGIAKALTEGQSFSAAVARYPQHFSPLYTATVQASERTGSLQEALRRFVEYHEQMNRLRKKVVSACLYPALLLGTGSLVVLFLLFYVIPRFSKVYESFSGELPFFSKLLITVGSFIGTHGAIIAASALSMAVVVGLAARTPWARAHFLSSIAAFPAVAENIRLYEVTRLYRTLGMLLKAGLPVVPALGMLNTLLSASTRERLDKARTWISEGRSISSAMTEAGLVTPVGERMLLVGEKTGSMGHMMERLAAFHEEDLARWIEDFSKLFEPVLMLVLGVMVGAIVVLMYMPIFELATAVQS